jgi:flagellar biosynthesis protein FliQ
MVSYCRIDSQKFWLKGELVSPDDVITIAKQTIIYTLLVSSPMLIAGLVVGVFVSIFQAVTSIQDITLTFIPKIVVVMVVGLFFFPWMMNMMISFTLSLFGDFSMYVK